MASLSRRRTGAADYTWPGYVDALTALLMVMIFLLSIFSVAQFSLSDALTNKDTALDRLSQQLGDIANQLALEKNTGQNLQKNLEQLALQLQSVTSERDRLGGDLAAQRRAGEDLRIERDQLTERLTSMLTENNALAAALQGAAKEAETRSADLKAEIERQRLELGRVAAALAAANAAAAGLQGATKEAEARNAGLRADVERQRAELARAAAALTAANTANTGLQGAAKEAEARSVDLKAEIERQRRELTRVAAALAAANAAMQSAAKEADAKGIDLKAEIERQRLELTRVAAAMAAANNEKGKLFSDLTQEQKLSAEQKAAIVRMTAEMAAMKQELARLNFALDASDAMAREQHAQIADLGQKLNRALANKVEELARYRSEFFGKLRDALAGQKDVQIVGDRFVFQSEVLFPSSSAELQPGGEKQLADVGKRLVEIAGRIPKDINWVLQIDGHTDNRPINTALFPSNWELSTARAIAVVKFLNSQGIPNERLVAAGYGEFQPLGPNTSLDQRSRNRRIELKLTNR